MARARIVDADGVAAVRATLATGPDGGTSDRATLGKAVRYTLQLLADRAPGFSVEVRVPPSRRSRRSRGRCTGGGRRRRWSRPTPRPGWR